MKKETMSKEVAGLLISGGVYLTKISDEELENYDSWVIDYLQRFNLDIDTQLDVYTRAYKLILGIMKRNGEYDERYHLYLLGQVLPRK